MTLALALVSVFAASAQIVSSSPAPLSQDSKNVVITYRPNDPESNQALANLPSSTDIYAHVGLITSKSTGNSDWKYSPTWGDNSAKYKLTYVGPNEYTLNIGDIASFFGVPASEKVTKLAFVFRTADSSKQGKTKSGGDIFLALDEAIFSFTWSPKSYNFLVGDEVDFRITNVPAAPLSIRFLDKDTKESTVIASVDNATVLDYKYKLPKAGSYRVYFKGMARNPNTGEFVEKEESIDIVVAQGSPSEPYPGGVPQPGAVFNNDGSVTFCIAAPGINSIKLVGSWDNWAENLESQSMKHCNYNDNRYFWLTVNNLDPNKQHYYYYYLDLDNKRVADPYSQLVLIKGDDNSTVKNVWAQGSTALPEFPTDSKCSTVTVLDKHMNDYNWAPFEIPNPKGLYIYELLLRDFTGTEGKSSGNGTVRQAIEKIPYLVSLGINAVELMPIMEFHGNQSWGYNTDFYFAPDKAYGSPADYKEFIDECHKNGIAVILDIVFNQCQDHPYYQMYAKEMNPFINASNVHDYSVLNDWNQGNPIVKQMWDDCVKYWLKEYNVDGFRFDLVKGLGDNDSYGSGTEAYNQSRVNNMARIHAAMKTVKPNSIHINEFLGSATEEKAYAADGQLCWGNLSGICTNFMKGANGSSLHQLSGLGNGNDPFSRVTYSESHDEERVAYSAKTSGPNGIKGNMSVIAKRAAILYVAQILSPGPTMLWQFQELVADQTTKNSSGNDTGNKKVIWSNLDNPDYFDVYEAVCAAGELRASNPELFVNADTYNWAGNSNSSGTATRNMVLKYGQKEVVVLMNPGVTATANVSAPVTILNPSNAKLVYASRGVAPVLTQNGTNVQANIAPNGFAIFATNNTVSGIEDAVIGDDMANAEVYGGEGEIVIVGEYTSAEVYNIQGVAMGRLTDLERGIYIVRVDGTTSKVSVR